MIRRLVLRLHLTVAVAAGLVILAMAGTGVILSFEGAALRLAEQRYYDDPPADDNRSWAVTTQTAASAARAVPATDGAVATPRSIAYSADPRAPARVRFGRDLDVYADPYTGEVRGGGFPRLRAFFDAARGWHRWLGASSPSGIRRGRFATGAANALLAFLIVSGVFLWRAVPREAPRAVHRHRLIGIWSAAPLAAIAGTALLLSYPRLGDRVSAATGHFLPLGALEAVPIVSGSEPLLDVERALDAGRAAVPDWRDLVLTLPRPGAREVRVEVRTGEIGQPQKTGVLAIDLATGTAAWESFADAGPSRRAQQFFRFAHTGEYWGPVGRALAATFSLAAAALAWTGLSMAARRLRARGRRAG